MDELPQLWNIFKGEMSFVGPKPLLPDEIEVTGSGERISQKQIPGFCERHSVTPGLTGLSQIYAARDIPRKYKFRYDRIYVENQTFRLDMKLIALSFWITFHGRWEQRGRKI